MKNKEKERSPFGYKTSGNVSLKIAGIYLLLGTAWILFSDIFLASLAKGSRIISLVSIIKGLAYVIISALVIYNLIHQSFKKIRLNERKITESYDQLTVAQEILKKQYEEMEEYQNQLHYSAHHDLLTGLPNRLSLNEKISKRIDSSPHTPMALLFIDLDNFKLINDTMGHSFGDQLLIYLGERLSLLMGEKYELHRLGGDEFIVCCFGFDDLSAISHCADEILQSFNSAVVLGDSRLHITVSIGVSVFPENGVNPDELLQSADIAMNKAKTSGKNRVVFYDADMKKLVSERMNVEKHLRDALKKQELLLYYQPQIDIIRGEFCGFEALLRWDSPELGFTPPLKFISIAEETRLIIPIGEWVLHEACSFLKQLQVDVSRELTMAVNISILQLLQDNFVEMVLKTLEETNLKADCLELEITESVLVESYDAVNEKLHQLREAGVKIALDDFGQGYSSLSYLQKLPIHTLKIDKSFVDGITCEENESNLTGTIIDIGRKMGLTILAEGVEREDQLNYLKQHQCHRVQGYLFSKPLPPKDALMYCRKQSASLKPEL